MIINCLDPIGVNKIYGGPDDCCAEITCKVTLSPGEVSRLVTKIENHASDCNWVILTVNGEIYDDPLTTPAPITSDSPFVPGLSMTFTARLCPCEPVGSTFQAGFRIHYSGGNQDFLFTFEVIDIEDEPLITQTDIDLFPCINPADCTADIGNYLSYNNPTPFNYTVTVNVDCDPVDPAQVYYVNGVLQSSNVITLPPGSGQIGFGFCPPDATPFICRYEFLFCEIWTHEVDAIVTPVFCGPCGLNCLGAEIQTENNYLAAVDMFCSAPDLYDRMAIGERKRVKYSLQYDGGFSTGPVEFWFNPWMYSIVCDYLSKFPGGTYAQPPYGWYRQITPLMVGAGPIPMWLFLPGAESPSNKNWEVFITVNAFTVDVEFDFYTIYDVDDWITNTILPNQGKLMQNHVFATFPQLTNGVAAVYNSQKNLCAYFWIEDPNVPGGTPFKCHYIRSLPITGRFWNKGLYNGPSEFTNHSFTLERGSNTVRDFSTLTKTKVTFKVQNPLVGGAIDHVVFWVFDQNSFDNSVDFYTNYDSSRAEILTDVTIAVIDNHLESPSTAPTLVGGFWEVTAYVGTGVNAGTAYRIGAVCYDDTNQIVNSFISELIPVTEVPGVDACCPLDFAPTWSDYHNVYPNTVCMSPTMKERIKNDVLVTADDLVECLSEWGFVGDWRDLIVDISCNVYTGFYNIAPPFPAIDPINIYFYYETYQSTPDIFNPIGFNNPSPSFVCERTGGDIRMTWKGRVRYEANVIPAPSDVWKSTASTPFDRVNLGGGGGPLITAFGINYDWANREIVVEYIIKLDLTTLFGQPFFINQTYQTKFRPVDFETNPVPYGQLLAPLKIEGWDGSAYELINGPFCAGKYEHLLVTMNDLIVGSLTGWVIGFLDFNPYGVGSLQEDDGPALPGILTQLTSPFIYDVPGSFGTSPWTFKIDLSLLVPGDYQICGLFHNRT